MTWFHPRCLLWYLFFSYKNDILMIQADKKWSQTKYIKEKEKWFGKFGNNSYDLIGQVQGNLNMSIKQFWGKLLWKVLIVAPPDMDCDGLWRLRSRNMQIPTSFQRAMCLFMNPNWSVVDASQLCVVQGMEAEEALLSQESIWLQGESFEAVGHIEQWNSK